MKENMLFGLFLSAARPANDDDDYVTDLTGAAAGQIAKRKRGTAQALPVCCRLWGCSAGPHLVWNFLRACARGRALGCRMDALRVARTSFRARISAVQLLAVLGADASVSSVLRLARSPCICRLEVCAACARVQVTVSGERLSLGSLPACARVRFTVSGECQLLGGLRGVRPCLLHHLPSAERVNHFGVSADATEQLCCCKKSTKIALLVN
jgi:hypothetical protein